MGTNGHTLYTKDDFTNEEIEAGNQIAEMVIMGGLGICKKCGEGEAGLDDICKASVRKESLAEFKFSQEIDDVFEHFKLMGVLPELDAWCEIELYRKFNNGHLPTDPLHTPKNMADGGGGIKISVIGATALKGRYR